MDQGVIWGVAPNLVADWRGSSTSESIGGPTASLGRERAKRRLQIDIDAQNPLSLILRASSSQLPPSVIAGGGGLLMVHSGF